VRTNPKKQAPACGIHRTGEKKKIEPEPDAREPDLHL